MILSDSIRICQWLECKNLIKTPESPRKHWKIGVLNKINFLLTILLLNEYVFIVFSFFHLEFKIMKTAQNITMGACPQRANGEHYSIYAYNKFCDGATGMGTNKWIMLQSDSNKELILSEAKKLQASDKFQKIEVKQKFFDTKKQRHFIKTLYPSKSMAFLNRVKTMSWIALAITIGLSIAYLI